MFLLDIANQVPVDAVEKVSTLITKEGAATVGLSIVLVCFLIMFIYMMKRSTAQDSAVNSQLSLIRELDKSLASISHILGEHTKVLNTLVNGITEEISQNQLEEISDLLFSKSVQDVMDYLDQIVYENHIVDKSRIELKVHNICANLYSNTRERAVNFKYKGQPLSFFLDSSWRDDVASIMIRSIYTDGGYNRRLAKTDIILAFERIKGLFIDNINKKTANI